MLESFSKGAHLFPPIGTFRQQDPSRPLAVDARVVDAGRYGAVLP
jgi:hypothetical protein